MTDRWTDRLSEYLDGTLSPAERETLDAHLATCAPCRKTLDELRRVKDRALALDDRPPTHDLWAGIASRIGSSATVVPIDRARAQVRRFSFTVPQLVAAGIALVALSSGAMLLTRPQQQSPATTIANNDPFARNIDWMREGDSTIDAGVSQLRESARLGRGVLDTATVKVLEKNLAIIDSALIEARRAFAQDPRSAYLIRHLADTMRRKMDLLRRANALAGARS